MRIGSGSVGVSKIYTTFQRLCTYLDLIDIAYSMIEFNRSPLLAGAVSGDQVSSLRRHRR